MPRVRGWIERFTASHKIQLSQQQQQAVEMAAYSPFMILTGGPGVGKTFTTHTIVQLSKAIDLSENSKAKLFKALRQNFDICVKT
jgi:exodeoxyribonuclease V alpha subunit